MATHYASESEFFMWRALFAFAFSDNVMSDEEKRLLKNYQEDVVFSPAQLAILREDFAQPKPAEDLYLQITDHQDKLRFCALARALMWNGGSASRQEEDILVRVGCMREAANESILRESRDHPHLHAYYDSYMQAGSLGLLNSGHTFRVRV